MSVTTIVHHKINKDLLHDYLEWQEGISEASTHFEGFVDTTMLEPGVVNDSDNEYVIIFKFETKEQLDAWLSSDIRQQWLTKADRFSCEAPKVMYFSDLDHWFIPPGRDHSPPRYKMTVISFLAIFPLVWYLPVPIKSLIPEMHLFWQEVISTGIITILMSYLMLPLISRLFKFWLHK